MIYSKVRNVKEGGFGKVIVVRNNKTKKLIAAKLLLRNDKEREEEIKNDFRIVERIHQNYRFGNGRARVIRYLSIAHYRSTPAILMDLYKSFDVGQMITFLRKMLQQSVNLTEQYSKLEELFFSFLHFTSLQVAMMMKNIHNLGIAHRDLKQSNILVNLKSWDRSLKKVGDVSKNEVEMSVSELDAKTMKSDLSIILIDFGFAIDEFSSPKLFNNRVGTRSYEAPEILRGKLYFKKKKRQDDSTSSMSDELDFSNSIDAVKFYQQCDVWAFGNLLYKLIHGRNIFGIGGADTVESALEKINSFREKSRTFVVEDLPESLSDRLEKKFRQIILSCLNLNGEKRPSMNEIYRNLK